MTREFWLWLNGRGELADVPPPDCDCDDCQEDADFAAWAEEMTTDA